MIDRHTTQRWEVTLYALFSSEFPLPLFLCVSLSLSRRHTSNLPDSAIISNLSLWLTFSHSPSLTPFLNLSLCFSFVLPVYLSVFFSSSISLSPFLPSLSLSLSLFLPLPVSPSNCPSLPVSLSPCPSLCLTWQASWHWGLLIICPLSCMLRAHEVSRPESLLYRSKNIIVHLNLLENIFKSTNI